MAVTSKTLTFKLHHLGSIFIIHGLEFGLENEGRKAIIVWALYGGKSAGTDYWCHICNAIAEMDFLIL
jgi:hypothetical protein